MTAYGLLTVYNISASIGVSKSGDAGSETWTYAPLEDGWDNLAEALNEVVQQYQFLKNKGFATNHVTGMAPAYTLTGRRVVGDQAQDYIFGKKYGLDTERQSSLKLEYNNAEGTKRTITCNCTLCNIQEFSGAATDDSAVSVEIRFDEKPVITPAA